MPLRKLLKSLSQAFRFLYTLLHNSLNLRLYRWVATLFANLSFLNAFLNFIHASVYLMNFYILIVYEYRASSSSLSTAVLAFSLRKTLVWPSWNHSFIFGYFKTNCSLILAAPWLGTLRRFATSPLRIGLYLLTKSSFEILKANPAFLI